MCVSFLCRILAHQAADDLEAGYIEINGPVTWARGPPFGGWKESGIGTEGNIGELLSYTREK
ncbi:aldehyde dehydrogenase family protein [Shimia abyssi]|uniref:Aldehyde dehydrogenase family protein n=1 Tax=Shimia abyssi TaxID=1662395 RepID=A0A2P8FGY1_9RHOB|nr:aldehyde dehydrogenase family protein [Shimia abyssi]